MCVKGILNRVEIFKRGGNVINEEEVRHIAELAHLELTDEEVKCFARQLGDVLSYIEKLDELDTDDVEPTTYTFPVSNVFRKDEVKNIIDVKEILQNAPEKKDTFFRVPPIMNDEQ